MTTRILTTAQQALLADVRAWLGRLQLALSRAHADADAQQRLERSTRQLDRLFLLVVVGEFNAGKSALVNALLGAQVLAEGVTPTTTRLQSTRYGDTLETGLTEGTTTVVQAPIELLRDMEIVDTPGTNAIFREHEALTTDFVPRADLVLFITSADRPFTESEREFIQVIREWGKKLVVAINKIDILQTAEDVETVVAFVRRGVEGVLGVTPEIFPVSARLTMLQKRGDSSASPQPFNRFDELEAFLARTLDARERVRLKLLNPVGVADRVLDQTLTTANGSLALLRDDVVTLEDIERQLGLYESDMQREFRYRLSHADNALHEFENRGVAFFDDTLRLGRLFDLLNKSRLKSEYVSRVVADLPRTIERNVHEIIDWMVASDLRQWEGVMERLRARLAARPEQLAGQVGTGFTYDRARLLETVGRAADEAVGAFDKEREANRMAESVQMAVAGTALAQAGAIGLGTVVTALATTTFADVTGILAAGSIAALGLFVIPFRRQQAKRELTATIAGMRAELMNSLTSQFTREIQRSQQRIRDGVLPYSQFVRGERDKLTEVRDELTLVREGLAELRLRIEQ